MAFELPKQELSCLTIKNGWSKVYGLYKNIYFDIGDRVEREDTLFEMESAEFDILKSQQIWLLEQANSIVNMYKTRMDSINRERKALKNKVCSTQRICKILI